MRDFLVEVDQALYRMQQSLDDSPSIESVLYQAELLLRDVIVVGSVVPAREEEVLTCCGWRFFNSHCSACIASLSSLIIYRTSLQS